MDTTSWQHPSPFFNDGNRDSLPFLREIRRDSAQQIAKFERMAADADARAGGFADAARLREWAQAERGCLADIDARIAARKSRKS